MELAAVPPGAGPERGGGVPRPCRAARQVLWAYAALGTAVVVSFCRLLGIPGDGRPARWRALLTAPSLLLAVVGLVGMNHYAEHGDVDVTGPARLVPDGPVNNGAQLQVVVDNAPERSQLRLVLAVEDALPGAQSCTPDTEFTAEVAGVGGASGAEGVRAGEAVEFPLGGLRGEIRVRLTLLTDQGCLMDVSVAEATLHD